MTRRLRAAALALLIPGFLTESASAQSSPRRVIRAWPVMGTMLTVTLWGGDTATMLRAAREARDSVRLVDSLMSSYREESEISRLAVGAGGAPQHVSPQTLHVLLQARLLWRVSGGRFDPTVGPLVRAWGFHGDSGRVPTVRELDSLRALVDYARVEIDSAASTVRLTRAGMELDLGGIAKGYALDLARAALRDSTITGGMVDLGGNLLVFGRPPRGRQWVIGVRHPRRDGSLLGTVSLDSGAVATSGDYEHFYRIDGVRYGHLIDPTTGRPSRGVIAATAIGPRGEWSDGLSATLFLSGAARGRAIADSLAASVPGFGGLWVVDRDDGIVRPGDVVLSVEAQSIWAPRSDPRSRRQRRSAVSTRAGAVAATTR